MCFNIQRIEFKGTIPITFTLASLERLEIESAKSAINALVDYAGTEKEFAYTLSFHNQTKQNLDAEGAIFPNGTTWREYLDAKGWNY
jgi:hypothetical protein